MYFQLFSLIDGQRLRGKRNFEYFERTLNANVCASAFKQLFSGLLAFILDIHSGGKTLKS